MPVPRALPYPWSPWDPENGGTPLDNQDWTLDARSSMLILTDVDASLQTTSRHAMVHRGRRICLPNGAVATTWHVGAPTRESDITTIKIEDTHGKREAALAVEHAIRRPVPSRPALDAALDLENLVGVQVDRIDAAIKLGLKRRGTTGAIAGLVRPEWPELESTILKAEDPNEPTMSVIVRHAETLGRTIRTVSKNPRRVLRRLRKKETVSRIQEMDAACLHWYVKQPGRNAAEKAGPQQRLMAVVREDTTDTLENRVLKDYLVRSMGEANIYLRANRAVAQSQRFRSVRRYGTLMRRLRTEPHFDAVRALPSTPSPNYVLLQDANYKHVWKAYLEIVGREQVLDQAWTWQRRLWSDTVTMMLLGAPSLLPDADVHRSTLPYLRFEQDHGRWLHHAPLVRTFRFGDAKNVLIAVERIDLDHEGTNDDHGLLADVRIDVIALDTQRTATGYAWGIHASSERSMAIEHPTVSAQRAIHAWARKHGTQRSVCEPKGLVLQTQLDAYAAPTRHVTGGVTGLTVPIAGAGLTDALSAIHDWLLRLVEEVTR